ncbi:CAP10 domain-containing protein [Mycena kentingensis (nom. inval.)]|nr:CAP10 domain-containing protein [Mycena kentingensis (nom. inval.)]
MILALLKSFPSFARRGAGRPIRAEDPDDEDVEGGHVPLLPLGSKEGAMETDATYPRRHQPQGWAQRLRAAFGRAGVAVTLIAATLCSAILLGIAFITIFIGPPMAQRSRPSAPPDLHAIARADVDALFARQSTTLEQASARYTLRTGRPPPRSFPAFFQFATERKCLIDEYDRVHRDFKAYYQLEKKRPGWFRQRVERAATEVRAILPGLAPFLLGSLDGVDISRAEFRGGEVNLQGSTAYDWYWPATLKTFAPHLPNFTALINGRDEPRIAFDLRAPNADNLALAAPRNKEPFTIAPPPGRPTEKWFHDLGCGAVPAHPDGGFGETMNEDTAFLISPARPGFTTDLYPMLSMTKIADGKCFADILFPTEYYYDRSWWAPHFSYPEDVPWEKKFNQLYWRGMSNGGMIVVSPETNYSNYHAFPRFRLATLAKEHPDLINAHITTFAETLCLPENGCDRDAIIAEFEINEAGAPREEVYAFKYAMDVDGTTFSGRFLSLLRSGSVVFKATSFAEYFNDWLLPYEHYIPVRPDLSDLVEKLHWAEANPEAARLIQLRGKELATRVMRDDQNDCYYLAVLGEWAELWGREPEGESE